MGWSAGIAVLSMVGGLVLSYLLPNVPPSFAIVAVASGCYALTFVVPAALRSRPARLSPDGGVRATMPVWPSRR